MEVKRVGSVKQGDEMVGNEVLVKVTKNKVAPPFKEARFNVMYGQWISKIGEILDAGIDFGVISKSGSWFAYGDEKLGQGRINVEKMLKENTELFSRIEAQVMEKIREKLGLNVMAESSENMENTESQNNSSDSNEMEN